MFDYQTRINRTLELWFDEPEPPGRFDIVVRHRACTQGTSGQCEDFYNLHVDLSQSLDEIFQGFARNTRTKIQSSIERDDLQFDFLEHPTIAELEEFIDFYDAFADSKGLPKTFRPRLLACLNSDTFSLSRVVHRRTTLAWHSNVHYGTRIGLMHSVSHFRLEDGDTRKMIGRANRRLHWEEMLHYKALGFQIYDFGGWYEGTSDRQLLAINQFKEEFGGKKVREFTVTENRSLRAMAVAAVRPLL